MGSITKLLKQASEGNQCALDAVLPVVENELHALAAQMMRAERSNHTLQPTALVHEAYLRLVDKKSIAYVDRRHFLAVAAKKMREVLRNHARDRRALKRGGGSSRVPFPTASSSAMTLSLTWFSSTTRSHAFKSVTLVGRNLWN